MSFLWKKLRFSSFPRAKVRLQEPPGAARAQPSLGVGVTPKA